MKKKKRIVDMKLICLQPMQTEYLCVCEVRRFWIWVKLVRPGVYAFVRSVDRGHGKDVERYLEWISEGANLTLPIQRMSVCEHIVCVWRRVGLERICMLGGLTKVMMVMSRACWCQQLGCWSHSMPIVCERFS